MLFGPPEETVGDTTEEFLKKAHDAFISNKDRVGLTDAELIVVIQYYKTLNHNVRFLGQEFGLMKQEIVFRLKVLETFRVARNL